MKIVRGTDLIDIPHPAFVIQGDYGIGKTSLIFSMRKPVCADTDNGVYRAGNRGDSISIENYADVEEIATSPDALAAYESIGIDTGGRVLDYMAAAIASEDSKWGRGKGDLSQQGYGELKRRFKWWLDLLKAQKKNILILAHAKEDKKGDKHIVRPDMTGGSYNEVLRSADFVGYMHLNNRGKRVIDFEPSGEWIGKNPGGVFDTIEVPPYDRMGLFMADLYERGKQALGRLSNENAEIKKAVAEWQSRVPAIGTADAINGVIAELGTLPTMVAAQAKRMIRDRAKELGLEWSQAESKYAAKPAVVEDAKPVDPPVVETAAAPSQAAPVAADAPAVDAPKEQGDKSRKRS